MCKGGNKEACEKGRTEAEMLMYVRGGGGGLLNK
jgi:hypothetical protein